MVPAPNAARRARALLLAVLACALLAGCARKPKWQEFSSPQGHFSITFPEKPEEQVKQITTAEGPVEMHEFLATQGERAYLVTYSDYRRPESEVPAATRLAGWREGVIARRKLISEREVTADNVRGREMLMETEDGLRVSARAFYRGRRLYQALVAAPTSDLGAEDTAHFLDSFKLQPE